ncbi:olfactory receptor 14K1-like [Tachyglossus aculeatus]|uniref:olfactory receptor 14K1-like n=1 Tax=Tachyglossus aculeatus TaxID=9261 RepID=UPI0018F4DBE6|nr:olfactory receptor 14K1-like [Tachyglossus aculeatus]
MVEMVNLFVCLRVNWISCSEDHVAADLSMITGVVVAIIYFVFIFVSYIRIFWALYVSTADSNFGWIPESLEEGLPGCRIGHFKKLVILTAMSCDHYTTNCRTLRYELIMNNTSFGKMQFFCDVPSLLKISCPEGNVAIDVSITGGLAVSFVYLVSIIVSYACIFQAISRRLWLDLLVSVSYTVVPPTLNPLISSLRNREMKATLGRDMADFCK